MSATMVDMELKHVDNLEVQTLEVGDWIGIEEDIVQVTQVQADSDDAFFAIEVQDQYEDRHGVVLEYGERVRFYVWVEEG